MHRHTSCHAGQRKEYWSAGQV